MAMDWKSKLRAPEPFDTGALQRHGDRQAGPVAYALRYGKPDFEPPVWSSGRDALRRFSAGLSGALVRALQERLLPVRKLPDWRLACSAMGGVFGFHHDHHFFHAAPLEWVTHARLQEPQVTKAIAYFLNSEDRVAREGRIRALLAALRGGRDGTEDGLGNARVTAEAPVTGKRRRMDLLAEWHDGEFNRGAVIEAKFGNDVTKGQLTTYRKHMLKVVERQYRQAHVGEPEPPLLFLVSPKYRNSDAHALAKNKDWRWKSWHSLLLAYDRFLDPQHDDEVFRQFRRTLWDRAG